VTWTQAARFAGADTVATNSFGTSVSISGTRLLAGANFANVSNSGGAGAAYVFDYLP
jgi:hypothetical protein